MQFAHDRSSKNAPAATSRRMKTAAVQHGFRPSSVLAGPARVL